MDLGKMYDCHVIDIGCGFGWQAVTIAMRGNNHVIANDIRKTMTQILDSRIPTLKPATNATACRSMRASVPQFSQL